MFSRLRESRKSDKLFGVSTTVRNILQDLHLDSRTYLYQNQSLKQQQQHYVQSTTRPNIAPVDNQILSPLESTTVTTAFPAANDSFFVATDSYSFDQSLLPKDIDNEWWSNAFVEDTFDMPLSFDASENGLWNGRFVPPPPRPPFLDSSVAADGLTTCDICSWAFQRNAYRLDGLSDHSIELSWAFTLAIVSIMSALIGAIVMVVVLRCRRIKTSNANAERSQSWWCRNNRNDACNRRSKLSDKHPDENMRRLTSNFGVWSWLGCSRSSSVDGPDQIGPRPSSPAENHYTHMDDAYSPVDVSEALYAELDRESLRSPYPSYQNTAYSQCGEKYNLQNYKPEIRMVVSSAPSSAYYSDLSVTAPSGSGANERAYEIVGLAGISQPQPLWESSSSINVCGESEVNGETAASSSNSGINLSEMVALQRRIPRLAAINETSTNTVPSDYV